MTIEPFSTELNPTLAALARQDPKFKASCARVRFTTPSKIRPGGNYYVVRVSVPQHLSTHGVSKVNREEQTERPISLIGLDPDYYQQNVGTNNMGSHSGNPSVPIMFSYALPEGRLAPGDQTNANGWLTGVDGRILAAGTGREPGRWPPGKPGAGRAN